MGQSSVVYNEKQQLQTMEVMPLMPQGQDQKLWTVKTAWLLRIHSGCSLAQNTSSEESIISYISDLSCSRLSAQMLKFGRG